MFINTKFYYSLIFIPKLFIPLLFAIKQKA